jgi:hypothetical protein
VSRRADIPLPQAIEVVTVTIGYLQPHCSSLLKNSIEVLLKHPHLSQDEKDLLIAIRVLFPFDSIPPYVEDALNG